jgi:hypothetical protein
MKNIYIFGHNTQMIVWSIAIPIILAADNLLCIQVLPHAFRFYHQVIIT